MRRSPAFVFTGILALVSSSVHAQNLLSNPGFDQNLSGWTQGAFNPQHNSADANGSAHSGSVRSMVPGGTNTAGFILYQCVPVSPGVAYDFSVKARLQQPGALVGDVRSYPSGNCSGATLEVGQVLGNFFGQPNVFVTTHGVFDMPGNAHSAQVLLAASTQDNAAAHTVFLDDVFFGIAAPPNCVADANTLCIDGAPGDDRFIVRARYATSQSGGLQGNANAISLSSLGVDRGGLFWFFSADNPELLVKILDGCASTHFKWVFISAGTNVGVNLLIADTQTGAVVLFHNPDLGPYPATQNIFGIPCQ